MSPRRESNPQPSELRWDEFEKRLLKNKQDLL